MAEVLDSAIPWVAEHTKKYVETDGAEGHEWMGVNTLVLTTTGRRTGKKRRNALIYGEDDGRYVIVASRGGHDDHPHWYLNLVAHPEVTVEVGDESGAPRRAVARTLEGDERTPVWEMLKATYPFFAEHEVAASPRVIPVVAVE